MSRIAAAMRVLMVLALIGGMLIAGAGAALWAYLSPELPPVDALKDVRLQEPLRVYTRDGKLLGEFGEKRRTPISVDQIPPTLIHAFLAAEDDRFYSHPGVDWQGLTRAVLHLVRTGEKGPGGSTITMQVARNFFLGREKTYTRKLNEILLSLKIERELSKDSILELYVNKIFLGQRAYGVAAAAQVYYGRPLSALTLAEQAMIAGLPKAPSRFNPVINPQRATARRNYVLGRMRELGYIDQAAFDEARAAPITAEVHLVKPEVEAPYVAEMARAHIEAEFGAQAVYNDGLRVYTTVDSHRQKAANAALRASLVEYDRRHGYRGPEDKVTLPAAGDTAALYKLLKGKLSYGGLRPAVVLGVADKAATLYVKGAGTVELEWPGIEWARVYKSENALGPKPKRASDVLSPGDLVRAMPTPPDEKAAKKAAEKARESGNAQEQPVIWRLAQLPAVEGALVALNPNDGAIVALNGGFDFYKSKFNRVTQAERQPGSSFKPIIYSAALNKGFTAASVINDAPVVLDDPELKKVWRPENYSRKFYGPTRLRQALYKSRNLVSIRLLRAIGVDHAVNYAMRFGFQRDRLPPNLSLSLGTATLTPLEVARAYAVFANGGFLIDPHFIQRVESPNGQILYEANPPRACRTCSVPVRVAVNGVAGLSGATDGTAVAGQPDAAQGAAITVALNAQPTVTGAALGAATAPAAQARPVARERGLAQPSVNPRDRTPSESSSAQASTTGANASSGSAQIAPRVIEAADAWVMSSILGDVIQRGTATRAKKLGRKDLSGKTGTTNDQMDAWFSGFNKDLVATAWVGFDQLASLGRRETGGKAALPAWMKFMKVALEGVEDSRPKAPKGVVSVGIDPRTGLRAAGGKAITEYFRSGSAPTRSARNAPSVTATAVSGGQEGGSTRESLF